MKEVEAEAAPPPSNGQLAKNSTLIGKISLRLVPWLIGNGHQFRLLLSMECLFMYGYSGNLREI